MLSPKSIAALAVVSTIALIAEPARSESQQEARLSEPVTAEQIAKLEEMMTLADEYADIPDDAELYLLAARASDLESDVKVSEMTAGGLANPEWGAFPRVSPEEAARRQERLAGFIAREKESAEKARKNLEPLAAALEPYGGSDRVLAAYLVRKVARDAQLVLNAARDTDSVDRSTVEEYLISTQLVFGWAGHGMDSMISHIKRSNGAPPKGELYRQFRK